MSRSLNAECLHNEAVGSMSCNIRASLRRQVWIKHKFGKLKLNEKNHLLTTTPLGKDAITGSGASMMSLSALGNNTGASTGTGAMDKLLRRTCI